jgi:hypothetical protein
MCEHPGCRESAEYRAPKDRSLTEYYWFCYEHVSAYNRSWNYYAGMSIEELQKLHAMETLWDRPLNPFSQGGVKFTPGKYDFIDYLGVLAEYRSSSGGKPVLTPEQLQAVECLGLSAKEAPFPKKELKARYNKLAKLHHPDRVGGNAERFTGIALAYKTLLAIAPG